MIRIGTREVALLGLVAVLSATLISLTLWLTRQPIAAARERAAERHLLEALPRLADRSDIALEPRPIPDQFLTGLGLSETAFAYQAIAGGRVLGIVVPTRSTRGYGGPIRLRVGFTPDGTIAGVRVVEHRETPGIGDRILNEKSDWLLTFAGRSRTDPAPSRWRLQEEGGAFDGISGATVSSRAVVEQIRAALHYFAEDSERLLAIPEPKDAP